MMGQSRQEGKTQSILLAKHLIHPSWRAIMRILLLVLLTLTLGLAHADNGLVSVKSAHDVKTTLDRLEAKLKEKGLVIFTRINHAARAKKNDMELRPTELLLFGNPKIGTPLMQCGQTVAIDLPQKALAWEDAEGQVWLSYNDPGYLNNRHQLEGCDKVIEKVSKALGHFTQTATQP